MPIGVIFASNDDELVRITAEPSDALGGLPVIIPCLNPIFRVKALGEEGKSFKFKKSRVGFALAKSSDHYYIYLEIKIR